MKLRTDHAWLVLKPARLFLAILALIFVVETSVMLVLPLLLGPNIGLYVEAWIDALLLTLVVAPMLWWLVVLPLRALVRNRTKLLRYALSVQEDEQRRIARDLHDSLGQSLTGMLVALRAVEETTADEELRSRLRDIRQIGGATHDEIRRIVRGLRPSVLDDLGLVAALRRLVEELRENTSIQVSLDADGLENRRLPRAAETSLFRVAQEALSNAVKHAAASRIDVAIRSAGSGIELSVCDDGRGFDVSARLKSEASPQPFGLWSIRERIALLAGTVSMESSPGKGTRIVAWVSAADSGIAHGED